MRFHLAALFGKWDLFFPANVSRRQGLFERKDLRNLSRAHNLPAVLPRSRTNVNKVVQMCLFHDTGEARSGDQNWIHKRYTKVFEDEIAKGQLGTLPFSDELMELNHEYQERKTLESKLAKDADMLDQILLLKEYAHIGNQEAATWLKHNNHLKLLKTTIARNIAKEILEQNPSDW